MVKLRVFVNAVDLSASFLEEGFLLEESEGGTIDVLALEFIDPSKTLNILDGHEVILEDFDDNTIRFFGGLITEARQEQEGLGLHWTVTAQDWKLLLDRSFFSKVYTNQTDAFIISDAFTEAEVTEINVADLVQTGRTIARLVFNGVSLRQMMQVLKSITGFYWDVNPFKKLIYRPEGDVLAAFNFDLAAPDLSTTFPYQEGGRSRTIGQFNAVQIVRGHKLTNVTDTYSGDGTRTDFNLRIDGIVSGRTYHQIFRGPPGASPDIPIIEKNTGSDGTPTWTDQTVGREGSSEAGVDVIWNNLTGQLRFTTAPPNFANNSWRIQGQYLAPVVWEERDEDAIASAGRVFMKVLTVTEVETDDQAQDLAEAFLREQGAKDIINCVFDVDGLKIGDGVNVNDPTFGVNKLYKVHKMSTSFRGGTTFQYTAVLGNGPIGLGEVAEILRELSDKANKPDISPSEMEAITIIRKIVHNFTLGAVVIATESRGPRYFAKAAGGTDGIIAGRWASRV